MKEVVETKTGRKSIYHKAADYSIIAIAAAFLMSLVFRAPAKNIAGAESIISLISGILFFSAVPAGIFSLFGIRKWGAKGLLVKGLFGTIVPLLMFAMAVPAFLKVKETSQQKHIDLVLAQFSETLPVMVDADTRLDEVFRESKSVVIADFTIVSASLDEIDMTIWDDQVVPLIRENSRNSPLVLLINHGVEVVYRYKDKNGKEISRIRFSSEGI